jgi:hypothetical protein
MAIVFRLLYIARALLICCLVYNQCIFLVITQIALALLVIISDDRFILVILRYKLKISNVKTILSGLVKLLIVLTAIYKIISLLMCLFLSSSFMILYI